MKVSYEGIGAWSATFETADVREGQVVKLSAPRTVSPCAAGDAFCGVAGPVRGRRVRRTAGRFGRGQLYRTVPVWATLV